MIKKLAIGAFLAFAACATPKPVETVADIVETVEKKEGYVTTFKRNGFEITDNLNNFPKFTYNQFSADDTPGCELELSDCLIRDRGCECILGDECKIDYIEINKFPYFYPSGEYQELGRELMKKYGSDMDVKTAIDEFNARVSSKVLEDHL